MGVRMAIEVVWSNILLLWGAQYKEAHIRQRLDLPDGAVMALLMPWQGYIRQCTGLGLGAVDGNWIGNRETGERILTRRTESELRKKMTVNGGYCREMR